MAFFKLLGAFTSLFLLVQHVHGQEDIPPFDSWPSQKVALPNVTLHFKYYGTGPPVLLVHGQPQHSLTWHTVGPLLAAQGYTVLAPDTRGSGASTIPSDEDYTAEVMAEDLKGMLDFLEISQAYVVGHDLGCRPATALAAKYPERVPRVILTEFLLAGFGFENFFGPTRNFTWDVYSNWQLPIFSVPDVAEFLLRDRERQFLAWFFWHSSYQGLPVSDEHLERYTREMSKPGFIRSTAGSYAAVWVDYDFFVRLREAPLTMPTLVLGGEASLGPFLNLWQGVASDLSTDVVPKAGHWIADENPRWVARRVVDFLRAGGNNASSNASVPVADLSYLSDRVTLL